MTTPKQTAGEMTLDETALKAAQDILHDVLMADMNPEKAGRHVSTERLTKMMINAYFNALEDVCPDCEGKGFWWSYEAGTRCKINCSRCIGDGATGNAALGLEQPSIASPSNACYKAFDKAISNYDENAEPLDEVSFVKGWKAAIPDSNAELLEHIRQIKRYAGVVLPQSAQNAIIEECDEAIASHSAGRGEEKNMMKIDQKALRIVCNKSEFTDDVVRRIIADYESAKVAEPKVEFVERWEC